MIKSQEGEMKSGVSATLLLLNDLFYFNIIISIIVGEDGIYDNYCE